MNLIPGKKYYVWDDEKPKEFTKENERIFIFQMGNFYYCVIHGSEYEYNSSKKALFRAWENIAEIPEDKFAEEKKAYAEGKQIQYFSTCFREWLDVEGEPLWEKINEYRVKPEPKYRAFTQEEYQEKFMGYAKESKVWHIKKKSDKSITTMYNWFFNDFNTLLQEYENLDGSPLGVEE